MRRGADLIVALVLLGALAALPAFSTGKSEAAGKAAGAAPGVAHPHPTSYPPPCPTRRRVSTRKTPNSVVMATAAAPPTTRARMTRVRPGPLSGRAISVLMSFRRRFTASQSSGPSSRLPCKD